jgi:hypothetical protein
VQLDHRVPGQALVVLGDEREAARLEDLHVAARRTAHDVSSSTNGCTRDTRW